MKFIPNDPPRTFRVGADERIELKDCGRVDLAPNEQITFVTTDGGEYDVVRKDWGFYATPSLNSRLPDFGLRPALVRGLKNRYYVLLVEQSKEHDFRAYISAEGMVLVAWMDSGENLHHLERAGAALRDE